MIGPNPGPISQGPPLQGYAKAVRLLVDRKAIGRVALLMEVDG
jgi:hypothetical protein